MEEYLNNKTILIVDDTPENIDVLNNLLVDFKRKIAINGERALKLACTDNPPDLILLDIMMPGMDGYEVCKKLREDERTVDVPVIFLTAKTAKEDVVKGFEAGGQDYVTKPFDVHELMERVKTQLQLKHQKEQLANMNAVLEQKVAERTAQLKESNDELDNANKKLTVLDDAKNDFLQLISHEIRTPLNGILGSTYFLKESIEDPEMVEFMDMLAESADRLDRFSRLALDITQLQTQADVFEFGEMNFAELMDNVVSEFTEDLSKKDLEVNIDNRLDKEVISINEASQKALSEVLHNAVKFAEENTSISIELFENEENTVALISNKGPVIEQHKIDEIVKPFGLAEGHYDKNAGLGLAYVQLCMEAHKGMLNIENLDDGVAVSLIFPGVS